MDDVVAAREDAHVGGTRVEDDDVAELLAAHADRLAAVGLGLRGARDGLADLRVGPGGQTGAVEAAGLGAAPHVRGADLRARGVDDLLAGGDGRSGGGGAVDDRVGARDGAGDALDVLDVLDIRDVEGTDTRNVDRGGRRGRRGEGGDAGNGGAEGGGVAGDVGTALVLTHDEKLRVLFHLVPTGLADGFGRKGRSPYPPALAGGIHPNERSGSPVRRPRGRRLGFGFLP